MNKLFHPKIAALVSAMMVVLTGNVSHGETMSKNLSRSRPAVPPVQTTKGGSRYVRPIDVLRSITGRKEIARQLENSPKNGNGKDKKEVKEKT
jgi:hypothetical protein